MDNFGRVCGCVCIIFVLLSTLILMNKFAVAIYLRASSNFRLTHRAIFIAFGSER